MKSILLSSLFIILGVFATCNGAEILSPEIQEILSRNDGINSVEYVGASADGRVYFKDLNNILRTWQEARTFCEGFKLEQGAVTTRVQLDFLLKAHSEGKLPFSLWTSAREQRNTNMLAWDKTSANVDLSVFKGSGSPPSESYIPFQVCGVLDYLGNIYFNRCSLRYYVLCQTP